jgi:hypothetical protein
MELLLDCAIRAALFAAAVAGLMRLYRIANASARHKAWCSVMLTMLLLPLFSAWGPKATLRVLPAVAVEEPVIVPPAIAVPAVARATEMRAPDPPAAPKPNFLLIAYFAGAGWMLLRLALGAWRAASLIRRASIQPEFRVSSECSCPLTLGWLRPVILLPTSWHTWPAAELDAVLAHERAHVRRRDPLVQWLAGLNRAIFWFHPLAWWLERKLAAVAEEACDAAVVASGHDPRDYSEYLLHQARAVERAGTRVVIGGAAMGYGGLADRIPRLLNAGTALPLPRGRAIAASALCAAAIALFAACRLDRAEQRAPGQPTMNELMHRRTDNSWEQAKKWQAQMERARAHTRRVAATRSQTQDEPRRSRHLSHAGAVLPGQGGREGFERALDRVYRTPAGRRSRAGRYRSAVGPRRLRTRESAVARARQTSRRFSRDLSESWVVPESKRPAGSRARSYRRTEGISQRAAIDRRVGTALCGVLE